MQWTVETVAAVDAEIDSLPVALRARLVRLPELIEEVGLEQLRALHVRHLEGNCGNCGQRTKGALPGEYYVTATGRRVVVCTSLPKSPARRRGVRSIRQGRG